MAGSNLVYSIHMCEDGSVALADSEGQHVTYKSNWGDLLHYLRDLHWAQHPAHQDNEPETTSRASNWLPRVARK